MKDNHQRHLLVSFQHPGVAVPPTQALATLRNNEYLLETAEKKAEEIVDETPRLADAIVEIAGKELAAAWRERRTASNEAAGLCGVALHRVLSSHATRLMHLLDALREQLESALAQSCKAVSEIEKGSEPLPKPSGLPLFDATRLIEGVKLQPPTLGRLLGAPWLRSYAWTRLKEQLGFSLSDFLDGYRLQLRQWLRQALTELRGNFHARAGLLQIQLAARLATTAAETDAATDRGS